MASDELFPFWRKTDPGGQFCNWYESDFTYRGKDDLPPNLSSYLIHADYPAVLEMMKGFKFNCVEQFMMTSKASLFGDLETFELIMNEPDPSAQKKLGRRVKNFNQDVWDTHCTEIVTIGCWLKFSQNAQLRNFIVSTYPSILVEGSPFDTIWGVGLRYNDPRILDVDKWEGKNLLGECLMEVRKELL